MSSEHSAKLYFPIWCYLHEFYCECVAFLFPYLIYRCSVIYLEMCTNINRYGTIEPIRLNQQKMFVRTFSFPKIEWWSFSTCARHVDDMVTGFHCAFECIGATTWMCALYVGLHEMNVMYILLSRYKIEFHQTIQILFRIWMYWWWLFAVHSFFIGIARCILIFPMNIPSIVLVTWCTVLSNIRIMLRILKTQSKAL